ncbi:Lipoprotein signal peptidase [Candidatus Kinetoplastibacterium sorsogonicusi]|uniref:Lipoprotein signal peptidase n=1 Tax=Candidatus Kinetoplastidibacterium kentomonadis TaxID=1576550 RepID=A0A3Q8F3D2_9PROT|nr:signal peptidase II [Candidatus Kinetoplastibacterium sorsogonicusi]AWD32344.1 Lipoprotein signal peptidase [Candidatus Kinetoplastibacterium sorsogonicusi]
MIYKNLIFKNNLYISILIAFFIIIIDQITKNYVENHIQYNHILNISNILSITLIYNYGAAFSILSDQNGWQIWFLIIISSIATLIFLILINIEKNNIKYYALSISLGGIIGNLIDRMRQGYVIDFIFVHYKDLYLPIFNVADICISIGITIIIINDYIINKTFKN